MAVVPDFRHVADFSTLEFHGVDVVGGDGLAGWRYGAALFGVGALEAPKRPPGLTRVHAPGDRVEGGAPCLEHSLQIKSAVPTVGQYPLQTRLPPTTVSRCTLHPRPRIARLVGSPVVMTSVEHP